MKAGLPENASLDARMRKNGFTTEHNINWSFGRLTKYLCNDSLASVSAESGSDSDSCSRVG